MNTAEAMTQTTIEIFDKAETLHITQTLREDLIEARKTISILNNKIDELEQTNALLQRQKDNLDSHLFNSDRFL